MALAKRAKDGHSYHIRDARGRKVTQLDPVAMDLLRQHGVIEAEVLRGIAGEKGVRMTGLERTMLVFGLVGAFLVIGLFTHAVLTGDLRSAPYAKSASLIFLSSIPWIIWFNIKKARFGKVAAAMLKYLRCPHCGYDLRMLPTDPEDEATVCPECGCAWKLDSIHSADDHRDAALDLPPSGRGSSLAEGNGK